MSFEILNPMVASYLEDLIPARHEELQAMEVRAKETGFPIIGPVVGHLCYQIARMIDARRIFELGSGYGYSTAWFARAIQEAGSGEVVHTVWDAQLSQEAREHLSRLGLADWVHFEVGEAVQILRDTQGPFDIIFNDIDKHGYPASLPVAAAKLRPGGVLIVDNMLLRGRILDPQDESDSVAGVRAFTRALLADPGWSASLIPIRDGIMLAYKY